MSQQREGWPLGRGGREGNEQDRRSGEEFNGKNDSKIDTIRSMWENRSQGREGGGGDFQRGKLRPVQLRGNSGKNRNEQTNSDAYTLPWTRGRGAGGPGLGRLTSSKSMENLCGEDDNKIDNIRSMWENRRLMRQRGSNDYQVKRSEQGQCRDDDDEDENEQTNSYANISFSEENWTRGGGTRGRGPGRLTSSKSMANLCSEDDNKTDNIRSMWENRRLIKLRGGNDYQMERSENDDDEEENEQTSVQEENCTHGTGRSRGFKVLLQKLKKRFAQDSPKVCIDKVEVKPWQAKLLSHCFGTFEKCRVHFNNTENMAVFKGPEDKVKQRRLDLLEQLKDIKQEQLPITPRTLSILNSEKGKAFLEKILDSDGTKITSLVLDECLLVAAKENDVLRDGIRKLEQRINYKKETIRLDSVVPLLMLKPLQKKLECDLLVRIAWSENRKEIYLDGIEDDVLTAAEYVNEVTDEYKLPEMSFQIVALRPPSHAVKYEKLSRPPCVECLEDRCGCGSRHFDSVMGDGKWLFREFVVYEMSQCYPEYIIKYERI